ncbi:MAG: M20 family metallopeptidase [Ruminococcaceae bacterium]|nr:M20 family metallopeptidase [Oscillospiraceae bacterium]
MSCVELFSKVDALKEKYFKVWEDVCNIESPTKYKEGVDAVGQYFVRMAEEKGFKVEYFRHDVSGNVICITMNPDAPLPPLTFSAHMDTVHPVGMFGTPAVHKDEEKIYGPGVADCKGGLVAAFMAMDVLQDAGFTKRPILFLLQSDEEGSSMGSNKATIGYMCEKAKDSIGFINLEGYAPGYITIARKGILSYRFDVEGKETHSSRCAVEGANAIIDAAHKMLELDKLKDDEGITCNCALVSGGTVVNTVAGHCSFSVNFRYATQEQQAWIENYVKELAATVHVPGCSCTVEKITMRVSMEWTKKNENLANELNRIFEENDLPVLTPRRVKGGADAADTTVYGIPSVDSLGVCGGGGHSIREYAWLESLPEAAKRLVAIAMGM